jgi:hypothetical protein
VAISKSGTPANSPEVGGSPTAGNHTAETGLAGWGARIRTSAFLKSICLNYRTNFGPFRENWPPETPLRNLPHLDLMNAIYSIFKHLTYTERQMLLTELNHRHHLEGIDARHHLDGIGALVRYERAIRRFGATAWC